MIGDQIGPFQKGMFHKRIDFGGTSKLAMLRLETETGFNILRQIVLKSKIDPANRKGILILQVFHMILNIIVIIAKKHTIEFWDNLRTDRNCRISWDKQSV